MIQQLARLALFAAAVAALDAACVPPTTRPPLAPGHPAPTRTVAEVQRAIDDAIGRPEFRSAEWGVLVVDPATGDTLYAHNADKLFLPASNMKLVTMAVALTTLGADYRWTTTVAARGPVQDGVLRGDLAVIGRGDPSVSDSVRGDAMLPLRAIADSVWTRGVRIVTGRLVAVGDAFPGPTIGFGWSWDDLDDADGAAIDELLFNDGYATVHVRAGATPGAPASATTSPAGDYPALHVDARTVAAGDSAALRGDRLRAVKDTAHGGVKLLGTIAVGDSVRLHVTFNDPDAAYLAALREALTERGIRVLGGVSDSTAALDTLARDQSPTLGELLPAVLKPSQNQMAEMVLRTVGLVATGVGRADSAARVEGTQLVAWGADSDGFLLRDGSGLARYDYLSPRTIVRVLDAMRRAPVFTAFYGALPVAGRDGTLRHRMQGTPGAGAVHAKTGSLANTRSLSGYATAADGRTLLFSALCNNFTSPPATVTAIQDSIAVWLTELRNP